MYLFKIFDNKAKEFINDDVALTPAGKVFNLKTKRMLKKDDHIVICHKSNYVDINDEPIYEADVVNMTMEMPDGSRSRVVKGMVVKTQFGFFSLITTEGEIPEFDPTTKLLKFEVIDNALKNEDAIITYDVAAIKAKIEAAQKAKQSKIIMPASNGILS